jgi:predicted  nucleic acid-binding Zn-ribbon protein
MYEKEIQKIQVRQDLQSEFNGTIDQRVERYLEIDHQNIIGNHHFASASSECINIYSDGRFISAVMVSQAVNEGIVRFIAERNNISLHLDSDKSKTKSVSEIIDELEQKNIITHTCAEASRNIYGSFRNDVHHMNPKVAEIETYFRGLAKCNLQNLAKIEKEIFGVNIASDGSFILQQPKYWDCNKDGKVAAFLRFAP